MAGCQLPCLSLPPSPVLWLRRGQRRAVGRKMGKEESGLQVRVGGKGLKGAGETGQDVRMRVKEPRHCWVSWSEWFSQSRRCICRSVCRQLGVERSHRGKHPRKECLAGSHHRPEGHRSHSAGRRERSNKYTHSRAATGGSEVVMGEGRGWDKAEVGWGWN